MPYCELCDLDLSGCVHGRKSDERAAREARKKRAKSATLQVSPRGVAHFKGCPHKGDDPDFRERVEVADAGAWESLGDGEQFPAYGSAVKSHVARSRCSDCVNRGGPSS